MNHLTALMGMQDRHFKSPDPDDRATLRERLMPPIQK